MNRLLAARWNLPRFLNPPREVFQDETLKGEFRIRLYRTPIETLSCLSYFAENRYTVVDLYVSPGRSTVEGNFGLFGESG